MSILNLCLLSAGWSRLRGENPVQLSLSLAIRRLTTASWESVKARTWFIVLVFCLCRAEEGDGEFRWGEMM